MPISKLTPTYAFADDRLAELRVVVPEAFVDGKINWEVLQETLSEYIEEPDAEHFGLFWPGKREARRLASIPSRGTLVPVPGEGVDEESTRNVFIEGENLEVLKLMQKPYAGRVKMIYIDPPYNTGVDYVYPDDFSEPLEGYLSRTNQADEAGVPVTTNKKTSGRFHSNWLSMMYPRLRLARELLHMQGVIFVSIDDNELHNLRLVMDEIFGEENFVANIVWQKRTSPDARLNLGAAHDYILVFAKSLDDFKAVMRKVPLSESRTRDYSNPDNDPRGDWASVDLTGQTGHATPSQFYEIVTSAGVVYGPPEGRCWALAEATFKELVADGRIWFGRDGSSRPRLKRFLSEVEGMTVWTWWTNEEVGHNQEATKELNDLLGVGGIFDTPKPTRLINRILQLSTSPDDNEIVLDFFAGSCTTAQAVLSINREDGGKRKFIMVQLPEPTPAGSAASKYGYDTIAEIGKERIRRAIRASQAEDVGQLSLHPDQDLGFRIYRLDRSHFKAWHNYEGDDLIRVQTLFDQFESPLVEGWESQDLLTEILLIEGFPLDSTVTSQPAFTHNMVQLVTSDFHTHRLFVCLDSTIHDEMVGQLDLGTEDVFVCLDTALTDESKMRLSDVCNLKVI